MFLNLNYLRLIDFVEEVQESTVQCAKRAPGMTRAPSRDVLCRVGIWWDLNMYIQAIPLSS